MTDAPRQLIKVEIDPERINEAKAVAEKHVASVTMFRMFAAHAEVKVNGKTTRVVLAEATHQLWLTGTPEQLYRAGVAMTQVGIFVQEKERKPSP